jgi:hypothetical protein
LYSSEQDSNLQRKPSSAFTAGIAGLGRMFCATGNWSSAMRNTLVALTVLSFTTQAWAADRYQLIPLSAGGVAKGQRHTALLIDMTTGDTYGVEGSWNGPNPPYVVIKKIKVDSGQSVPGPAELSPTPLNLKPGGYTAIWKVNQTNGDTTFCNDAAGDFPPQHWSCATGHLP